MVKVKVLVKKVERVIPPTPITGDGSSPGDERR